MVRSTSGRISASNCVRVSVTGMFRPASSVRWVVKSSCWLRYLLAISAARRSCCCRCGLVWKASGRPKVAVQWSTTARSRSSPPEVGIAVGAQYLKNALLNAQNADVEGAAAEVVHGHGFLLVGVEADAVGQGRGGGLVHDAQHFEAGQAARVAGGLALRVVEISRHGDNGAVYRAF